MEGSFADREIKAPYADRGIMWFPSDVERDRFLELSLSAGYKACARRVLPDYVRAQFEIGAALVDVGRETWFNGQRCLDEFYKVERFHVEHDERELAGAVL